MGDEHLSLHSSAAAAPAVWTPRPPQLLAGPAAALACHHPPRQPAHWDHMMAVLTPQMIYYMTEIKVSNAKVLLKCAQKVAAGVKGFVPILTRSWRRSLKLYTIAKEWSKSNVDHSLYWLCNIF